MATFQQERHVELVSGANEAFVITNLMVSALIPDELPHVSVFVLTVNDVDDPKQDTLARVANIADLTSIPIGRDAGIATPTADGMQWLSASATVNYETLEVANDAAVVFQDRVNALVEGWILFRDEFNAPDPTPAVYTFPRGDATQKQVLIAAYKAAKQSRYQLQLQKTEADAALLRADEYFQYVDGLNSDVLQIVPKGAINLAQMSSVKAALDALLAASQTFYAAAAGTPPSALEKTAMAAALAAAVLQQSAAVGYLSDAAAFAALISAYQTGLTADVSDASTLLTTAQSTAITKTQQLTSAQTTETAALQAVLAVCPDFDKHSIPFVDDTEP